MKNWVPHLIVKSGPPVLAIFLAELMGIDGQIIEVNPKAVVSVRTVRPGEHFGRGAKCLIHTSDGKFIVVVETCDMARRKLEEPK